MPRNERSASETEQLARLVHRLAVLLRGGVAPAVAWGYLDSAPAARIAAGPESALADRIAAEAGSPDSPWRALAAAWDVATASGAPLAPALLALADGLRDVAESEREIAVALSGPRATARLVLVLPVIGLGFGAALGFDTVHTLVATPVGWGCLAVGLLLLGGAWWWMRLLVRTSTRGRRIDGFAAELVAIALSGGGAQRAAVALAAEVMGRRMGRSGLESDGVLATLELSARAGVPAIELLRAEAAEQRRAARAEARAAAETLAVRLMLPLGACVLPSFMVLSVIPLFATVVGTVRLG